MVWIFSLQKAREKTDIFTVYVATADDVATASDGDTRRTPLSAAQILTALSRVL